MELRRRGFLKRMGALGCVAASGFPVDAIGQVIVTKTNAGASAQSAAEIRTVKSNCSIRVRPTICKPY